MGREATRVLSLGVIMEKINHSKYELLTGKHLKKLLSRCEEDPSGCLIWTGANSGGGYGNISITIDKKKYWFSPHRAIYLLTVGPTEMELDHLCRNRMCCYVQHLAPVTSAENPRRGKSPSAINRRKTHCVNGHEFTSETTWVSPTTGRRRCRTCDREGQRRRAKKRTQHI